MPGTISQCAGLFSAWGGPVLFRGDATGFLTAAAGAGGALAADSVVAAVVGDGLWVGERPAGLGAMAGFGGSLGFSGLGLAGGASSSLSSGGGGGGGGTSAGAGAFMACTGLTSQVWWVWDQI